MRVTSRGDLKAREGVWLYPLGNENPVLGFKPAGNLIGDIYFRRSTLAYHVNGLDGEARMD